MAEQQSREVVDKADPDRRGFLRRAARMGFAVPVVASFSMSGMLAGPAYAQGNMSP